MEGDAVISHERIKACKVTGMNQDIEIKDFYKEAKSLVFDIPPACSYPKRPLNINQNGHS